MKRLLGRLVLVVVVLVIAAAVVVGSVLLGRQSITDGFESGSVRIVKDGMVSVGVVSVSPQHVALIDAGNDASGNAILAELSRRGLGPDAVEAVLLTHGHPDHVAAISLFPSAQVMALAREVRLVEGTEGAKGPLPRLMPVKPTGIKVSRSLEDDETVTIGNVAFHVYAVPGHTAGSAAYLVDGILFMGDAADVGNDGKVMGSPWVFSDNQAQDRASLVALEQRLRESEAVVHTIAFAHSGLKRDGLNSLTAFTQQPSQ